MLFYSRVYFPLLRGGRFDIDFQGINALLIGPEFVIETAPTQGVQVRRRLPLFLLKFAIFFGGNGLALQVLKLTAQFVSDVGKTLQVVPGASDPAFCFLASFLVFGDAGGFLDKYP